MRSNLPKGWVWSTFQEVGKAVTGGTPPKSNANFYGGLIPWVKPPDLDKGKYVFETPDTLTEDGAANSRLLPKGSVMVSCIGNLGKVAIAGVDLCTNQQINSIVFNENAVLSEYGYYYALTLKKWLTENSSATTIAIINKGRFEKAPIPVPPLAEQRRIVAQLEVTMQKLEASQERLEKLPTLLKKFRQAVLAAAVSGKLTEAWRAEQTQDGETGADLLDRIRVERRAQWEEKQLAKKGKQLSLNDSWRQKYEEPAAPDTTELPELPKGWNWGSLELLSERIVDCPHSTPVFTKEGEYCIDTTCMESGRIRFDKARFVTPACYVDRISRLEPREGDVLFAREGTIGTTAMVPANVKLCLGQRMMMFRPASLIPRYFMWAMISDVFVRQWRPKVMGTTAPHVNIRDLRLMALPVCSIAEQKEIVRQVNHYFELADQLESRFEQAAAMVEQLPQALLAKAFSGQLVPQDSSDEPASALLERLTAEVAAPVKGKRGRKAKVAAEAPLFN